MYKCQFGVIQNRHILDSLRKFLFFFQFLKSDKAEIIYNDNKKKKNEKKKVFFARIL